jgi:hypothetical protein
MSPTLERKGRSNDGDKLNAVGLIVLWVNDDN